MATWLHERSWLLLGLILLGFVLFMLVLGLCVQEDAFISFRYADNLVAGHGLTYNPGEKVEGYTNFLWTLLLAGGIALGLDPVPLSRLGGMTAAVFLIVLVFLCARGRDRPNHVTGGFLATALIAASPGLAAEAVQGLETVFFALLITAGVWLGIRARENEAPDARGLVRRLAASAGVLALAALTRPEGLGVFLLATGAAVGWRWCRRGRLWPRAEATTCLLFLVVVLPYFFWRLHYYGHPVPNTFYAKTGGGIWHVLRGLQYAGRFLALNPVLTLLTAGMLVRARPWRLRCARGGTGIGQPSLSALTVAVVVAGYLLYVIGVGGDFKRTFRFVLPVLPLWAIGLDALVSRHGWPSWRLPRFGPGRARPGGAGRTFRLGAAGLILLAILLNGLVGLPSTVRWARARGWDLTRRKACGEYLASYAQPDAVLAIHSAGIIPYYSRLKTIDMWGINDSHIARKRMPEMGRERPMGHEKRDDPYVFARSPTYYVDEWNYVLGEPIADLEQHLFREPSLNVYAESYRTVNVPLMLKDGRGLNRYWFNFLELKSARTPAVTTPAIVPDR
jgi:arabinofuranosyltransferase